MISAASSWTTALVATYYLILGVLALYGVHRLVLVWAWWRTRHRGASAPPPPDEWPVVTVQLPLYNERYVAERLIEAVARLDYPADRLEIQVLDDSTDDTRDRVARAVEAARARGVDAHHLHRDRPGGLQGGRPGGGPGSRPGRAGRGLRRRLRAPPRLPAPHGPPLHRRRRRRPGDGPGALGPPQPGLLLPHPGAGAAPRRPLPDRAHRPPPERLLLQLQRHGGDLAADGRSRRPAAGAPTP